MEAVAALALGLVMFMHAWQLFGTSQPKTTGIVGAVGAIALVSLVALKPLPILTGVSTEALAASMLIWAVYAALVAAVGLWDFEPRGLGLYSAYAAVVMIGQVVYCIATRFTLAGIICGAINVVAFALLFLYLAIPISGMKKVTAWALVLAGPIHGILGALLLMGALS